MTTADDDKDRRFRLDVLATTVQAELMAAGLPVLSGNDPIGSVGAVVHADVPELRGVTVDWQEHAVFWDASQEAWAEDPLQEGAECAAFGALAVAIGEAMAEAMRKILTAAGLEVADSGDDYAPHQLLVTRRLARSPWQARRDAKFERQQESMHAAWKAKHEAECPNHGPDR
ncbi:hypothetical protein [Amycolatopsis sp. CA-128772]|uniref:hypothetical protein n=1 Tax=Amycolatopsis sp. CA-128772 TaxID=2073159 RepID=UPI001E34840F|nr:hypothetical protein [Amycolatopsis sp. CA-128772]